MHILLFIFYTVLFSYCITRIPFIKKTGLSRKLLIIFFLLKIIGGCLYGYIHARSSDYPERFDTWKFHYQSIEQTELLKTDPAAFFSELFRNPYPGGVQKIFQIVNSYWNDLKFIFMVKLLAILNLFSFKNYYVNVVLLSFITFFGPVAIYRVFTAVVNKNHLLVAAGCFLIPSMIFWAGGIHKEGLLILSLGLFCFHFRKLIHGEKIWRGLIICFSCTVLIFILRNNVLFGLIPSACAWALAERRPQKTGLIFASVFTLFMIAFFTSKYFVPRIDLPYSVRLRQLEFISLGGNTAVRVDSLEPNLKGFIHNLPSSVNISFLKPYPGEGGMNYIPFTLESVLLVALILLMVVSYDKSVRQIPFLSFSIAISVVMFLVIGYTVPNIGAVVRYKSVVYPFLYTTIALKIDWKNLLARLKLKKAD